jgi:hypothetical protein
MVHLWGDYGLRVHVSSYSHSLVLHAAKLSKETEFFSYVVDQEDDSFEK